jgi:hypothetical protein
MKRLLIVWLGAVGFFLVLYVLAGRFLPRSAGTADQPWAVYFVVLFTVVFAFILRRNLKGTRIHNDGVALLQRGRLLEALRRFEEARPLMPRSPLVPMNVGTVQLQLWQLDSARRSLEQALTKLGAGPIRPLVVPRIALVEALAGQVEGAERRLAEAEKLKNADSPLALLAVAALRCRAGKWEEAEVILARNELRTLGGMTRGVTQALKAWCAEQLRAERRPVDVVDVLGEAGTEPLVRAWPELHQFLERCLRV